MTFQLVILGNNSAIPAHNRNPTAQLLMLERSHLLIDCGEGTQLQLARFNLRPQKIGYIFISHLHGDHYFGLIALISSLHLYGRKKALHLYAPPPLEQIIRLQLEASGTELNFPLHFHPLLHSDLQVILDHPAFTVSSFPLSHGIRCFGFLVREKEKPRRLVRESLPENISIPHILQLKNGEDVLDDAGQVLYSVEKHTLPPRRSRSYAYCSDTRYDESIVEYIRGVDLLYHEATFADELSDRASLTHHSTAAQAAAIARSAGVGRLLLGHYSTRYKDPAPLEQEARAVFKESYLSHEGQRINLEE